MAKMNIYSVIATAILFFCMTVPMVTFGLTVVECVDKNGDSTFAERCPPGSEKKGEKHLRGISDNKDEEVSIEDVAKDHPVTLFSVENCEACVLVRTQLQARNVPFTEVDVGNDQENFAQLTAATGGAATVPTLTVDDKVLSGHNSASLDAALNAAGYP